VSDLDSPLKGNSKFGTLSESKVPSKGNLSALLGRGLIDDDAVLFPGLDNEGVSGVDDRGKAHVSVFH